MNLPRGIRNHNPGNIERTSDRWIGMAADQSSDARFLVFDRPEHGIRALMRLLINYRERHGLCTVAEIIHRWAPPSDNNHTSDYAAFVAARLGCDPDDEIDTLDRATTLSLAKAIITQENGYPGDYGRREWYPREVYTKAAALAGFDPPTTERPRAQKSATVVGSTAAGVATVAGAISDSVGGSVRQASDVALQAGSVWPDAIKWVFVGVALVGVAVAIADRIRDDGRRVT